MGVLGSSQGMTVLCQSVEGAASIVASVEIASGPKLLGFSTDAFKTADASFVSVGVPPSLY